MKLLVNTPIGTQEVIEVAPSGGYFDLSRVLWDERIDGPLPDVILGGMVRVGGALEFDQSVYDNYLASFAPTPSEGVAQIVAQTQIRLDTFARTRNYDGILSACTYATSTVPKFAAEGQYCVEARDVTWATCYQIMADVQEGTRPMPSGYANIEGELPVLVWPEQ